MARPKVLISAYACEPGYGSEAGIGWNCVTAVAEHADIVVVTREANRAAIADAGPLPEHIAFVYYDLPRFLRFWKKGARGARFYYILWQIGILPLARRLTRRHHFDVIHHVTFGALWMPTFLFLLPPPFVWGPVGGGERLPRGYIRTMTARGMMYELGRSALHAFTKLSPAARTVAKHASVVIATTDQSASAIGALAGRPVRVLSHVALPDNELQAFKAPHLPPMAPLRVCSAGRLIEWKGLHLGIEAFRLFLEQEPDSEYIIIGEGPSRARLERLVQRLGISRHVQFMGHLTRQDTIDHLHRSHVLLHPSLHDSGGYICAEALAASCPVVCLDVGGPPVVVGRSGGVIVPALPVSGAPARLAAGLAEVLRCRDRYGALRASARNHAETELRWSTKGEYLANCYRAAAGYQ